MTQSFFGTVQGWVKREFGPDYGGRFIAAAISQVAAFDEKPLRRFLEKVTGDSGFRSKVLRLVPEVAFDVRGKKRRADLVAFLDDQPRLLIELKYRDRLTSVEGERAAQLADYLYLCQHHPAQPQFLLMCREPQRVADLSAIAAQGQLACHYSRLASYLRAGDSPASLMLLEYFEEQGLTMSPIDPDHLYRFINRLVLPWRGSGRVNKTSEIGEGPLQFQALLGNLRLIANEITPAIREAARAPKMRTPTIDFSVSHELEKKVLRKALEAEGGKTVWVSNRSRTGGIVDIWAQHALSSEYPWYYLIYGLELFATRGKPLRIEGYVGFSSPEIAKATDDDFFDPRFSAYGTVPVARLRDSDPDKLTKQFVGWIRQASRSAIKSDVVRGRSRQAMFRRLRDL